MSNKPLKGIVPPMITPLNDVDTLDTEGLERLIEHILAGGVSGLFILGTTGEFSSLSYRLRYELIEKACKIVNGRVPVLVGITDTSMVESINIANKAADSGADAVVAAPPYYFSAGQPELVEYFDNLVKKLPLPLYLYNMPTHTKTVLEPGTVKSIAENSKIVGLKDSSGNAVYFSQLQHVMKDHPFFSLFVGPEEITAELVLMGADGGVNGGANMFPRLYVDLYNAAVNHDFDKIKMLQEKVLQISSGIYTVGRFGSSYMKGLKCALSVMGICNDFMAEPFHRFRAEEREIVRKHLDQLNII
ncbi:MAG: dihydrodipicolinate synthase family protein [Bacteroidales bacterium]